MPRVDAVVETPIEHTFRVQQVAGMFDLPVAAKSVQRFSVDLPGLDEVNARGEAWRIGAIVGPSGSGKSTVARRAFSEGAIARGALVEGYDWPHDRAVVDGFDAALDGRAVTAMLGSVGFASPPAWVRPYHVLSNGERFRCDLARALLEPQPLVVVDEFTSVVDRQVARFGSAAVAKTIRKGRARCERFVAVTCHYDILDWLEPDWWLDMQTGELAGRWVRPRKHSLVPSEHEPQPAEADQPFGEGSARNVRDHSVRRENFREENFRGRGRGRGRIELEVCRAHRGVWRAFGRHHYLSDKLSPASRCYVARWNGRDIAFIATMPVYGIRDLRIVHRLVVLPDYQGLGVGVALLDAVAAHEAGERRVSIVTSHPALIRTLDRHSHWRCVRVTKCGTAQEGIAKREGRRVGSIGRVTASFRYVGPHTQRTAA